METRRVRRSVESRHEYREVPTKFMWWTKTKFVTEDFYTAL